MRLSKTMSWGMTLFIMGVLLAPVAVYIYFLSRVALDHWHVRGPSPSSTVGLFCCHRFAAILLGRYSPT